MGEPARATERFAAHVGPASVRRPRPNVASAMGALGALFAGAALAAIGVEAVLDGSGRVGPAILFGGYAAAGVVLVVLGAPSQRSAGVTAVTVAVPVLLGFLVLEFDGVARAPLTSILAASTVTWGILHVAGPTRGHGVLLAAALAGAPATILAGLDVLALFDPTVTSAPDTTGPLVACLLFASSYLAAGAALHRAGLAGTATAFVGVGAAALAAGAAIARIDQSDALAGGILLLGGGALAAIGHARRGRASVWGGGAAATAGAALLVASRYTGDASRPAGAALAMGALAVVTAPWLERRLRDPDIPPRS